MLHRWLLAGIIGSPLMFLGLSSTRGDSPPSAVQARIVVEIPPIEFNVIAATAGSVVRGRVRSRTTVVPERGIPYTRYEIEVHDTWKGSRREVVDFGVLGTDDGRVEMVGAPRFAVDDEIVAFLWTDASGATGLLGLEQGVARVTRDELGRAMVVNRRSGRPEPVEELRRRLAPFMKNEGRAR